MAKRASGKRCKPVEEVNGTGRPADLAVLQSLVTEQLLALGEDPGRNGLLKTPERVAKALAFMLEKSARCDMCGTAEWEWEADRRAYEPVEKFCMGCYLRHMAEIGRAHV